ncbi:MAG TPA: sugar kinase, partial [Alphaproteobacteria bacterium]|nr:sugar kinase [Alphaproteobacteria bacterium]
AVLAAVAAGIYPDPVSPLADIVKIRETIDPDPATNRRYVDFFEEWRAVYQSLVPCMDRHRSLLEKYAVN